MTTSDTSPRSPDSTDGTESELPADSECACSTDSHTLLCGLKHDTIIDHRHCPHENCHGYLHIAEKEINDTATEIVLCGSCRCTPDGEYVPSDAVTPDEYTTYHGYQYASTGMWSPQTDADGWQLCFDEPHDTYDTTNRVRLAGGYEAVYDSDSSRRPHGVDTEYTFDVSTL